MNYEPQPYGQPVYYGAPPKKRGVSPVLIVILVVVLGGFAALVGGVLIAAGSETDTADWVTHNDPEGAYSCKFPETPKSKVDTQLTAAGAMQNHIRYVENSRRAYMVMWADMPRGSVGNHNRTQVLDGAVSGAMQGGKGTLTSKRIIMVAGQEGREYFADIKEGKVQGRIWLLGDRLFQMLIVHSPGFQPEATFFFDSFQPAIR